MAYVGAGITADSAWALWRDRKVVDSARLLDGACGQGNLALIEPPGLEGFWTSTLARAQDDYLGTQLVPDLRYPSSQSQPLPT